MTGYLPRRRILDMDVVPYHSGSGDRKIFLEVGKDSKG